MRVLQVHNRYRERGGEDVVVERERELLTGAGHLVEFVEFSNPSGQVAAVRTLLSSPWNAKATKTVVDVAEKFRPDVVHVHNTWFALSPAVIPRLSSAGLPTVVTVHNYRLSCVNAILYRDDRICEECVGRVPWRGVVHRCYRNSATQSAAVAVTIGMHRAIGTWEEHADVIVALTSFATDYLASAGIPPDSIMVKPNVVRDPGPRVTPPSSSDIALFVGRLSGEKGIEDLFEAWSQSERSGLRLRIIGDGPLRACAEKAAETSTDMEVVGRLETQAVAEAMQQARALVFPSRWFEGMPMVLLESMAAGLPAIVPNHGALPEIVGEGAVLYQSGSVSDLGRALGELRQDQVVDQLGRRARIQYQQRFSPPVGLAALERVYENAIDRRASREMGP